MDGDISKSQDVPDNDIAPVHFYNPQNDPIEKISRSELVNHFNHIEKFEDTGGTIRQQIFGTTRLNYFLDQPGFNPVVAIRKVAEDYEEFKDVFRNKVKQLWETDSWDSIGDIVDKALTDIHIGKNINFRYANSDMAYWNDNTESYIPYSAVKLGFFPLTTVGISSGVLIGHDGAEYTATGTEFTDMDSEDFDVVTACLKNLEDRIHDNVTEQDDSRFNIDNSTEFTFDFDNSTKIDDWKNRWEIDHSGDFTKTSLYRFAKVEHALLTEPYKIFEMFWNLNEWTIKDGSNIGEAQWIRNSTNNRIGNQETHNLLLDDGTYKKQFGWNAICSEFYQDNETDTRKLFTSLDSLKHEHIVHMGGFTDKKLIRLYIDGSYDKGQTQISPVDYDIILDENAPIKTAFFSGVKIEKEQITNSIGCYNISGYDLDKGFFKSFPSSVGGRSVTERINESTVVTRYLAFKTNTNEIPYNTTYNKRQNLYEVLLGIGEYYESLGFEIRDEWRNQCLAAIRWTLSTDTEPFYLNGYADALIYKHGKQGSPEIISRNYNGTANVLDKNKKGIKKSDILVLRNDETTEYVSNTDIFGLGINVVEWEHMLIIRNAAQDDILYKPATGIAQSRILIEGERTKNWNGRIEAPGYLINGSGLTNNLESSVREMEHDFISGDSKFLNQ